MAKTTTVAVAVVPPTEKITLDNLTTENVGGLTAVELIELCYEQMFRVQTKTMRHSYPNEPLLEAYDEHLPGTLRSNNPKVLALNMELLKRFQPLRSRLTPQDKSRVTKFLKNLNFVQMIKFTSGNNTGT